jgi:hypothetical protein
MAFPPKTDPIVGIPDQTSAIRTASPDLFSTLRFRKIKPFNVLHESKVDVNKMPKWYFQDQI